MSSPMVIVSASGDDPTLGVSLSAARQVILVVKNSTIAKMAKDNFFISSPFLSFCSTVNVLVSVSVGYFWFLLRLRSEVVSGITEFDAYSSIVSYFAKKINIETAKNDVLV